MSRLARAHGVLVRAADAEKLNVMDETHAVLAMPVNSVARMKS